MTPSSDGLPTDAAPGQNSPDSPRRGERFHLRIWHKIALIVGALMIPLALACTYLVEQQNSLSNPAYNELRGTRYLRPLSALTTDLVAYRSLASIIAMGEQVPPGRLAAAKAAVDRDFAELDAADSQIQNRLETDLQAKNLVRILPAALKSDWQKIKATSPADALGSGLTQQLVANVLAQYSYVGEASELILDPDLDSYYAMTALLMNEPALVNQVSLLGDLLNGATERDKTGSSNRTEIIQATGLTDQQLTRLQDSINRSISATPAFNKNEDLKFSLLPLLNRTNGAVHALIGAANHEISSAEGMTLNDTQPLSASALNANMQLWNSLFDQYDRMVHSRIDRIEQRSTMLLAGVSAALMLIIILSMYISRRFVRNLSHVANASLALAKGDLKQRAHVASHDEVATLATTFNAMADNLQRSYTALQRSHAVVEDKVRVRTVELHERTKSLHLLQGVATAANRATTWDEALEIGLALICKYMGWPAGHAYTAVPPDDEEETAALRASLVWYTSDDIPPPIRGQVQAELGRTPSPPVMSALSRGLPVGPDPLHFDSVAAETTCERAGIVGAVAFPVLADGEVTAVVEFFTRDALPQEASITALIAGLVDQLGRVREREIANRALQAAVEAAQSATRAKSAFLATMSHEIRTPMNAVMGMTELLLATPLTEEQRSFAGIAQNSADSLLTIINDILDFSKIEAGKFELKQTPVHLRQCIESAFDVIMPQAREKPDLNLAYVIDRKLPERVMGDGVRLSQILINLLGNAIKFTDMGEIVLTADEAPSAADDRVLVEPEGQASCTVQFSVRDTGIGMPQERIQHLFHPFEQLDSSATRRFGGTGLGLAISRRLTELMNGTMWAESRLGEGSTFYFTITTREIPSTPSAPRIALRRKRMLVMDRNATNREILARHCDAWGMSVRATRTPEEALNWIRSGDPCDVAILGTHTPINDCTTLAREINGLRESLPMILLTAPGKAELLPEDLSLFSALHTKPIKGMQLYASLCKILLPEEAQPASRAEVLSATRAAETPVRILVAEDNSINQQLILRMLSRIGYNADSVSDGAQAVETLRRQPYDIVLMDIQMPVMNGLDASRAIRRDWPEDKRPRIIALTANAMREDREECLAAGMDDWLTKPLNLESLAAAITRHVPRRTHTPPPPAAPA